MTKALIITYYWPPAGGPGVQRWLKFSKYLPQNDVDICVLTVDPESATYPVRDESLLKEVSDKVKVFQTPTKEPFGTYKKATNRKAVPFSGFASESAKPNFKEKVARFVRGNFFYPDPRKGWRKFAINKAQEIIAQENIDVVITTGPPHSTHLIGLDLKSLVGVKWVADFRDPWTDIYYYRDFYPMAITRNLEKALEAKVLNTADLITTASPGFAKLLSKKMDNPNKVTAITNGYDHEDLVETNSFSTGEIRICYAGTLTEKYPLKTLSEALKTLSIEDQSKITLDIVGTIDRESELILKDKDLLVEVNLRGYVSHEEALSYLSKSSMLLLLIPILKGNEGIIPAKLFEYIGAGKTILGIGPIPSDAATVVNDNSFGKFFKPSDSQDLSAWMKDQLSASMENTINNGHQKREQFSRKHLSKAMASQIRNLTS